MNALKTRVAAGMKGGLAFFVVMLAIVLLAPLVMYPVFLSKVLCFALFAAAFNLLIGFGGLMSFGHAAFFGMASYTTAYAAKQWGLTPELTLPLGALVGAGIGLVVGSLAIRRQGVYFSMITLALAQMIYFFCLQAPFTGGEDGIQGVPRQTVLGFIDISGDLAGYYFCGAIFLIGTMVMYRVVHSPFGQVIKAIRDNEPRAISLGYDVYRYKLILFVLSAGFSGVAGALKATVFQVAALPDVHWATSGEVLLMTLVGGIGTFFGPLVGAFAVTAIEHYLAEFGSWVTIAQGVVFVVAVVVFPRGVLGSFKPQGSKPH